MSNASLEEQLISASQQAEHFKPKFKTVDYDGLFISRQTDAVARDKISDQLKAMVNLRAKPVHVPIKALEPKPLKIQIIKAQSAKVLPFRLCFDPTRFILVESLKRPPPKPPSLAYRRLFHRG